MLWHPDVSNSEKFPQNVDDVAGVHICVSIPSMRDSAGGVRGGCLAENVVNLVQWPQSAAAGHQKLFAASKTHVAMCA